MQNAAEFIVQGERWLIRQLQETDIPHIVDYWFSGNSQDVHEMCDVDFTKLGSPDDMRIRLLDRIRQSHQSFQISNALSLIVEKNGVAMANVIVVGDKNSPPHVHCNIWNAENRKKGFGSILFLRILKFAFDQTAVPKFVFETSVQNTGVNKLIQKFGIHPIKTHMAQPSPITRVIESHLYEVTKEQIEKLLAHMTN